MKPVKVAHLTTVDISLRYLVLPQLTAVVGRGGEALGISAPGSHVAAVEAAGVRHVPLVGSTRGWNPIADARAAWNLWRILRRERPQVLHTHNPKPGLYGRIVGRFAGVPVVVNTLHGLYATPEDPWRKRAAVYLMEAVAARFSDAELIQSAEDYELLLRLRITRRGRTVLLGNGVDLERFDPQRHDPEVRNRLRTDLGASPDQVVVGMVGRLVAEKGFLELFAAASRLDDRFVVVVVGPDDAEKDDALTPGDVARARAAGVRFLGMRTDVDLLYSAMDLFVLPSHREGFPRAAMEAAASGLPVIASDIRGCREVVDHGVTGLLVPVRDADALADAVVELGSDRDRRARMGAAARTRARERFDERRVVDTVLAVQARLLAEKGLEAAARALSPHAGRVAIRRAVPGDAAAIARLHATAIRTGFLPSLGLPFLTGLYRALMRDRGGVVLVAVDGDLPVGFVSGVTDVGAFYRRFLRRHAVPATLVALPRLLRPSVLRRAWETWRYDGGASDVPAELLSIAVSATHRGRGVGGDLGRAFLAEMTSRGVSRLRLVVGEDNAAAKASYERLGYRVAGHTEVHAGERSLVYVWEADSGG